MNLIKWIIGLIGVFLIAWLIAKFNWSAPENFDDRAKTETAITAALSEGGYDWADFTLSESDTGTYKYVARLTGEAPDDAAKQGAIRAANNVDCDCPWGLDRKVHFVDGEDITVKPAYASVSPYVFGALSASGPVVLSGYVPSESVRDDIVAEAEALFPRGVTDNLQFASGLPNDDWRTVVSSGLVQLSSLETGQLDISDTEIVLTGEAASTDIRDAATTALTSLPGSYAAGVNIAVEGAEGATSQIQSAAICQRLFRQIKGDAKIRFQSGSAVIDATSFPLLDRLASAAKQCSGFQLRLEGHTDSDGGEEQNQILSEGRAMAAMEYLRAQGVPASQMSASGYGETQPIASNDTPEGKARNRRIDFTVEQSN